MSYFLQVVIDCTEPHEVADWWAETLGWEVEPQDADFIRRMIDEGHATEDDTTVHRGALVWRTGVAIHAPAGDQTARPRIYFQGVPEPKTVKNRVHLDIRTGDDDRDVVRERLVVRGASLLYEGRQGPYAWVTMADPWGNEFCI